MNLEHYSRFAQALPDPILVVDGEANIVSSNSAARSIIGAAARSLREITDDDPLPMLRLMSRSRDPVAAGLNLKLASGELVAFRCDGALLQPRQGNLRVLIGMRLRPREATSARFVELNSKADALAREIKKRRRAEALLRGQAATLEMIINGAPLNVVLERIISMMEQESPEPVMGSILLFDASTGRLRHAAAPRLPKAYSDAIDGVVAGEGVGSCGTAAHRRTPVIVSDIATDPLWAGFRELALTHGLRACWSTPILSADGDVLATFALYRNVPGFPPEREVETVALLTRTAAIAIERKRVEEETAELHRLERVARADAEEANRMKDEFLATVSHELRTPLTAIVGWSHLLRELPHDRATREGIEVIDASAHAQSQIIEDLLDSSRIAADKLKIERVGVDLPKTIHEAVESLRPSARNAGVEVTIDMAPLSGVVEGDPERIRQVIWNLLTNAIKFAPLGHVAVEVADVGDCVEIAVTDDGEGISSEFLPHVFDRFSQADASAKRRHRGLGLGLSIVRKLVELHGGTIQAESEGRGRGSTFRIRLPYSAAVRVASQQTSGLSATVRRPLEGLRVLLVEDVDASRDVLQRILERAGAVVTAASSAADAIAVAKARETDLIVSDISMPDMDGYEMMSKLRDGNTTPPAIALTAFARVIDRERALASGFKAHLTKPVEPESLVNAIESVMAAERLARQSQSA